MKVAEVLIKPIVSEKSNQMAEKKRTYAFRVHRRANKLEIKKAVEEFYGVAVDDVHTLVVPGKNKTRYTKAGFIKGQKPSHSHEESIEVVPDNQRQVANGNVIELEAEVVGVVERHQIGALGEVLGYPPLPGRHPREHRYEE